MISQETPNDDQTTLSKPIDPPSSPRISFSSDFLDETEFISITPNSDHHHHYNNILKSPDFEFLSSKVSPTHTGMLTADQLFFEGKLLPFSQAQKLPDQLNKINLKDDPPAVMPSPATTPASAPAEPRIWFIDDDPSPRPPKCTVLWKELLRLKKQKSASSLSPSSSTSSSSSSSSSSLGDHVAAMEEGKKSSVSTKEKHVRRLKKGLERTKSATIRIRPMVNVPICTTQGSKTSSLPPLFPLKKGRVLER